MSDTWRVYGPGPRIAPIHVVEQVITPEMWSAILKRVEKLEKRVKELED